MGYRRTILLFTRAPEAEARAKGLPVAEGAPLFTGFLRSWEQRTRECDAELLVVAPVSSTAALARLLPTASVTSQADGSFGTRIEAAFDLAFARGGDAVLMVGGDCPPLPASEVLDAFAFLKSNAQAVFLAPAADGGVNVIGLNANAKCPFSGIAWQGTNVCDQLQLHSARIGAALLLSAPTHDLDSASDVVTLYRVSGCDASLSGFRWLLLTLLWTCRQAFVQIIAATRAFEVGVHGTRGPPTPLFA